MRDLEKSLLKYLRLEGCFQILIPMMLEGFSIWLRRFPDRRRCLVGFFILAFGIAVPATSAELHSFLSKHENIVELSGLLVPNSYRALFSGFIVYQPIAER